ncbi:MAG TPA: NADH:ubiquinone reductase (Na(+)-transporting) subunit C [Candidatus Coprenecus stercoripullorum]|nr:NADH:ubiquinone reductase (Na(+)-transporting) subunit C [Candidatus Coprenecus stercoripullorum]
MNTNSNTYTIIYSTIMVVVVAVVLAYVSISLSGRQQANVETETRQSILYSVNLAREADQAKDKNSYIETEYKKYITDSYLVNAQGDRIEGDAFPLALASGLKSQYDIMKQSNPDVSRLTLPVFVCTTEKGERVEIFAIYGAGLWGPVWGYISLNDDYNTVYGATFGHKGETPGLGAEIATPHFSDQFKGKCIFDGNTFTSVSVIKGGAPEGDIHGVDAISGGTITSRAVDNTIRQWFSYYLPYIEKQKAAKAQAEAITPNTEDNHEEGNI